MSSVAVIAAVVALVAAPANWWSRWWQDAPAARAVELVSKPVATIAIGAIGVATVLDTDGAAVDTTLLVSLLAGFACCLAGDVALLPVVDRFVVGLAAFLVGHVAFVVVFVELGLDRWWIGGLALVGAAAVAGRPGRRIVAGARREDPALGPPVVAYLAVISAMAVVGWATGRPAAVLGSAAFVASDAVLGWSTFVERRQWMPVTIMVTYHLALLGLALAPG